MRTFSLVFFLLFGYFFSVAQSPSFEWVSTIYGPSDVQSLNLDVDKNGNVFIIGRFNDSIVVNKMLVKTNGDRDILLAKYNSTGEILWAKTFGGIGYDKGLALSLDQHSNIYITGRYYLKAIFGNDTLRSYGHYDAFIVKLDSNGNIIWRKTFGGRGHDEGLDVAADISGNVYVTGFFRDTAFFENEQLICHYPNTFETFILKLNTLGEFQWARVVGGKDSDHGWGIEVSPSGKVVICGQVTDLYKTEGVNTTNTYGSQDVFVGIYSISGDFITSKHFGGNWDDIATDIELDKKDNIYITGYFNHILNIDNKQIIGNGFNDVFVAKLSPNAKLEWIKTFGGDDNDEGEGIALTENGKIYICGGHSSQVLIDDFYNKSLGSYDMFVSALNNDGNFEWTKATGGSKKDYMFALKYFENALYVTGYISDTTSFSGTPITTFGMSDAFVAKLDLTSLSNNYLNEQETSIYPNPIVNKLVIEQKILNFDKLQVMNATGQIVEKRDIIFNKETLEFSGYKKGIYHIRLFNNMQSVTKSIIKL